MKNEKEILSYIEQVKKRIMYEIKSDNRYAITIAKTILSTLMWILDISPLDLNKLENIEE